MRLRIALVAFSCAASLTLPVHNSGATDCFGIYSPCVNDDTLWPHAGYARFESVGSTQTLAPQQLGFGLVASYLSRPVVFRFRMPSASSDPYAVDNQGDATLLWSYGVARRLELDLALPLTLGQNGSGLSAVTGGGPLKDTAVRDMRFGLMYTIVAHRVSTVQGGHGGVAARFEVSAPTGDRDEFAGERAGVFSPSVVADFRDGPWLFGTEVGLRLRPTTEVAGARIGSQVFTSLGVAVEILPRELFTAAIEAWALPTLVGQDTLLFQDDAVVNQPSGKWLVPAEWQLTARTAPTTQGDVSVQLGGGGALPLTGEIPVTTPRFRFTLGIRWAPTRAP
jgi:hypothetical protein